MNRFRPSFAIAVFLITISTGVLSLQGQDWPGFRGTNGDARSPETGLLTEWPADGPELLWTAEDVGEGYSSVAIQGQDVFTIGDRDDGQYVFRLSADDGSRVWEQKIGGINTESYSGSRSTPNIHDGLVYCLNTEAVLYCLDAKNGDIVWQKDLVSAFGAQIMLAKGQWQWKFSESPVIDGEHVIVSPGAADAGIVALNRRTGDEVWRCSIPGLGEKGQDGAGYSTAVIGNACGVRQVVQMTGRGVVGVDAESGKFLWGYNRVANDVANISSPVVTGDLVFASTGYQTGAALLELSRNSDGTFEVHEKYFLPPTVFQNHHGGFVLHEGHIYGGHGHKLGLPICIRLEDGNVQWGPIRNEGTASAAVCIAKDRLYFRYQNGLMVLIEATPQGYVEKGSFMIPRVRRESWSHPAISNGKLYLKEQDQLHCYDISAG